MRIEPMMTLIDKLIQVPSTTPTTKTSPKNFDIKNYAKSITYGGLDGIITTFAVVAGAIGGNLGATTIIILGFSNLLADGFSMAAGDYLSSTTEDDTQPHQAIKNASITFLSFNLFGLVPLLAYLLVASWTQLPSTSTLLLASGIVSLALALLGYVKASITQQDKKLEIIRTLLVGSVAAAVAYGIGQLLGCMV